MRKDKEDALRRLEEALLAEDDQEQLPLARTGKARRIYNSDRTDTDLEDFSEAVRKGRSHVGRWLLIGLILAGVLWLVLKLRGDIG